MLTPSQVAQSASVGECSVTFSELIFLWWIVKVSTALGPSAFVFLVFEESMFIEVKLLALDVLRFSSFYSEELPSIPAWVIMSIAASSQVTSVNKFIAYTGGYLGCPGDN